MKVHDNKSEAGSLPIIDVPIEVAFMYDRELYVRCGCDHATVEIKCLRTGRMKHMPRSGLVLPRPDAEIHIGPHPAEAKLKKLVAFVRDLQHTEPLPSNLFLRIEAVVRDVEADDEQE